MLIRYGVSNFRSIRDYQEFSLVASALKDVISEPIKSDAIRERLLPVALIYGANASGKSTVLSALSFLRAAVLYSNRSSPTAKVPRRAFGLSESHKAQETQIDCDFILEGVRYHFGFRASDDAFEEEWLFSFPEGNRRKLYERKGDKLTFGKYFKGKNNSIAALTKPNSLFLSSAAQNAHEEATRIFKFFEVSMGPIVSAALDTESLANSLREGIDDRILRFLKLADIGVTGGRVQETSPPDQITNFYERIKGIAASEFSDVQLQAPTPKRTLSLSHSTGENGDEVFFDLNSESRGTLRLLKLLRPVFYALDEGGIVLIDEIDASVHTLLAKEIIEIFSSRATNHRGAQLIATTHDTTLLCMKLLRRDQIWFTEKDASGATSLYPLTDMKTRQTDNLEKGYLEGRFGAIPFLGDLKQLLVKEGSEP